MKLRSAKQFLKIYLYLMCVGSRKGRKKTGKEGGRERWKKGRRKEGRGGYVCHDHGGQRTIWWSQFSPSIFTWVPGIAPRSVGLGQGILLTLTPSSTFKSSILTQQVKTILILYLCMLKNDCRKKIKSLYFLWLNCCFWKTNFFVYMYSKDI